MKEMLTRLFAQPGIAAELIVASLFINILALASPMFVMQVLKTSSQGAILICSRNGLRDNIANGAF